MNYVKRLNIFLTVIFGSFIFKTQAFQIKNAVDSTKKSTAYFELSFGQSLLFISENKLAETKTNTALVIPTSSFLFLLEFRPERRLKIPVFLNSPTENRQFLVDGKLLN